VAIDDNGNEISYLDIDKDNQQIQFEFEIIEYEDWAEVAFLLDDKKVASMEKDEDAICRAKEALYFVVHSSL